MTSFTAIRRSWALPALLALVVLRFLIASPAIDSPALWQSGRFVYAAQQMLHGAALYRDVWSHVPPLIYPIDMLGWALGGLLGIWLVELLFLLGAVVLSYRLMRKAFGATAAFFGTACWLLGLSLLLQGNQIEEYGLLLQFAALYAFDRAEARIRPSRWSYLTGILIGLLFLLRPDLIGVGLAIFVYFLLRLIFRRPRYADARLLTAVIGALASILAVVALLAVGGALGEAWAAVVGYNLAVEVTNGSRLDAILNGVQELGRAALPLIALLAWVIGLANALRQRPSHRRARRLIGVALIALPVEVILSSLGGSTALNHLIPLLPTVGILSAAFASSLLKATISPDQSSASAPDRNSFSPRPEEEGESGPASFGWPKSERSGDRERGVRVIPLLAALLIAFSLMPLVDAATALQIAVTHAFGANDMRAQAIDYLRQNTQPGDSLLVWGAEPMVSVLSERRAPTRFFEQLPLFVDVDPQGQLPFTIFAADVTNNRPAYVLDTSTGADRTPPINPDRRNIWNLNQRAGFLPTVDVTPELQLVLDTFTQYYRPVARFDVWILYARADVQPGNSSR